MKTVFIIGAGASRAAGGPLMNDFILKANEIHRKNNSSWAKEHFEKVMIARQKLQVAYAKSTVDLDNIENLFSTFEMASLIGCLSNINNKVVEELPINLRFLIMRTLEQSILFDINGKDNIIPAPYPYGDFIQLLIAISKMPEVSPIAVINFNYDLCLDYAITIAGKKICYGLEKEKKSVDKNAINHFKVHGSLNWFRDDNTGIIKSEKLQGLDMTRYWDRYAFNEAAHRPIDTMELLYGPDKWGASLHPEPIIVPPTWNKGWYQEQLKSVWRSASNALSTAENIFVIGYSLPASDQFFRSFYSISTISETIIDKFWLFDPSNTPEIIERFKSLLGPAITKRERFKYDPITFSEAIIEIAKYYGLEPEKL